MRGVIVLVVIGIFLTLGCVDSTTSAPHETINGGTDSGNVSGETNTVYSFTDVAAHSTGEDCWTIIEGNVYDITSYVPFHPGGPAILQACGTDGTNFFNERPNDGTSHSDNARTQLAKLKIGVLG